MPTLSKLKKTKPGKPKGGAIASAQRELLEKQTQIEAQIKALQASIEHAPERAAKPARSGSDRFAGAVPLRGHYTHRTTIARQVTVIPPEPPTRRPAPRPAPMLRAERLAARRQTMALIVGLTGAVIYALSHLLP